MDFTIMIISAYKEVDAKKIGNIEKAEHTHMSIKLHCN